MMERHDDFDLMADINVTPFIDVMLVLLVIFMITAPLMLGGVHVNLPKTGGDPMPRPESPLIVSLDAEARIFVDKEEVMAADRPELFHRLAQDSESGEVYVRGDGEVKYALMMELMAALGEAGFARVTLVSEIKGGRQTPVSEAAAGQTSPASEAARLANAVGPW